MEQLGAVLQNFGTELQHDLVCNWEALLGFVFVESEQDDCAVENERMRVHYEQIYGWDIRFSSFRMFRPQNYVFNGSVEEEVAMPSVNHSILHGVHKCVMRVLRCLRQQFIFEKFMLEDTAVFVSSRCDTTKG